jgi:soluble lytic murein transglycosylase-like protein
MSNLLAAQSYATTWKPAEEKYGLPPGLGAGLIDHETGGTWNPRAIRQEVKIGDASRGLTQILLRTARSMGFTSDDPDDLFDPSTNIDLGFKYLAHLYGIVGAWDAALSAYNGGNRPSSGFGARLTAPRDVVLARDQVTGEPVSVRHAAVGEFANQPYVDDVIKRARDFGFSDTNLAGIGVGPLAWMVGLGLAGAVVYKLVTR